MRSSTLAVALSAALLVSCKGKPIPPPDPEGADMVEGAVIAATESSGGIRLYKIQHVDAYPPPAGAEYHMMAYDPKVESFEDARQLWQHKGVKVAMPHLLVRWVNFKGRDHRIVAQEPVTAEEMNEYKKTLRHDG